MGGGGPAAPGRRARDDEAVRLLFATAEFAPLARVGGLAEAASGLVRALRSGYPEIDVQVVVPDYGDVELASQSVESIEVSDWVGRASLRHGVHADVGPVTLVDVPGMARPHPYVDESGEGWPDNDARFFAFSAAVAALAARDRPDLLHLNDWHTAAVTGMAAPLPPTVLTIHTLGYQGVTSQRWIERLSVDASRFAWYGGTNPLAGAIELADRVIAVSPNYATEIVTEAAGMGLHERLVALGDRLVGIRNGIDTTVWDPAIDPLVPANFETADRSGRAVCREALLAKARWPDDNVPVAAAVTRLVDQKGIDILIEAARFLPTIPMRLAVLGSGASELSSALRTLAAEQPDHVWFVDGYDVELAHWLFAGSDLYAMPSRFEPCGLGQMQAMAYGSIPVVTDVGGLHDTVIDADASRRAGTGFVSPTVDTAGVVDALHRGARALRHRRRREAIQSRGMSHDWSWTEPARRHVELYRDISS